MKYITIFTNSHVRNENETYADTLREIALELNISEGSLTTEPDPIDGNQYEEIYIADLMGGQPMGKPIALVFTEEQYARQQR